MRLLLLSVSVFGALLCATPAAADPGGAASSDADNPAFLEALHAAGITYSDPGKVIMAGKTMCELANRGEPGLEILSDLKATNPALTTDQAVQFAAIAARSYCPHHLIQKNSGNTQ